MGKAHFGDIVGQLMGQSAVAEGLPFAVGTPGGRVYLVDADRFAVAGAAALQPGGVPPAVLVGPDDAGIGGRRLKGPRIGVYAVYRAAICPLNAELVTLPCLRPRNKAAPEAKIQPLKGMGALPVIKITHHMNLLRLRRPDRKTHAGNAVFGDEMPAKQMVRPHQVGLGELLQIPMLQRKGKSCHA